MSDEEPKNALAPWEDIAGDLTTEADNAAVEEILGGFHNLEQIQVASGLPYLGLDKTGVWKYGQDAIEPSPGSFWGVDLRTARWGFVAWVDGKPAGDVMVSIAEPRPARNTLDGGLPWADQVSVELVCLVGSEAGTRVLFKTSSLGGVKCFMAYKDLAKRTIPREPTKPIAVVQFDTSSYKHAKYGQITNPVFKVAGWTSIGTIGKVETQGSLPPPTGGASGAAAPKPQEATAAQSNRRRRVS